MALYADILWEARKAIPTDHLLAAASTSSSSPARSRAQNHRSPTPNRRSQTPGPSKSECYFHKSLGPAAKNCCPPCSFQEDIVESFNFNISLIIPRNWLPVAVLQALEQVPDLLKQTGNHHLHCGLRILILFLPKVPRWIKNAGSMIRSLISFLNRVETVFVLSGYCYYWS